MMDLDTTHSEIHPHRSGSLGPRSSGSKGRSINRSLVSQIEALIPRLRRYARVVVRDPVAADDLVQDSLARALEKIHLWKDGTDLRAWLFTILHNRHISLARQAARQRRVVELQKFKPGSELLPNQIARLELRDLERAIARLREEHRSLILLVGLEGMSYEEAASVVDVPVGTVRSRVSRGRETLRMMTELSPAGIADAPAMRPNPPPAGGKRRSESIFDRGRQRPHSEELIPAAAHVFQRN
jgi:RNA polymerase sigma-70 factor (ECF subfamily)